MDHTASPSTGDSVAIKDFAYAPADLTVAKGTTLIFSNEDSTPHTATSADAGGFDTGPIQKDQTKNVTLEQPGTYSYICSFHPFMHGTVTVQP
jgi:plastocyanin